MSMDFVKALKAPMNVDGWFVKLLIGGIFLCVPILNFSIMGYVAKYLERFMNKEEGLPGSPASNLGELFVIGLKYMIGCMLLGIIFSVVFGIFSLLLAKVKLLYLILALILEVIFLFLMLVLMANFAIDKKILSVVGFSRAALLVKDNPNTVKFVLQVIGVSLIYILLMVVCAIVIIPLPFLAYALTLSLYNLTGQYIQEAPHLQEARAMVQVQ